VNSKARQVEEKTKHGENVQLAGRTQRGSPLQKEGQRAGYGSCIEQLVITIQYMLGHSQSRRKVKMGRSRHELASFFVRSDTCTRRQEETRERDKTTTWKKAGPGRDHAIHRIPRLLTHNLLYRRTRGRGEAARRLPYIQEAARVEGITGSDESAS